MAANNELEPGYKVQTIYGEEVVVEKLLGSGGQGMQMRLWNLFARLLQILKILLSSD